MSRQAADPFESMLAYATALGVPLPTPPDAQTRLDVLEELLETFAALRRLSKELEDARDAAAAVSLNRRNAVEGRNAVLERAAATLAAIVQHKDVIARRLKDSSTRSSIAVGRQQQARSARLFTAPHFHAPMPRLPYLLS